jgi:hypothetical protein
MSTHVVRRWTIAAVVLLVPALLSAAQQDYAIKLHRPAIVGQKYLLVASASGDESMTASVDGQTAPSETTSIAVELTARVTTLAVTDAGKESKVSLVIEKSRCSASGIASELLAAGTTVVAAREGEFPIYSVNDTPVNSRATQCLKMVVPLGSGSSNDDRVFGTKIRQKVGGSWPVNTKLAAEELFSASGLRVQPQDVSGSVRLTEVGSFNGQPALRIHGEMKLANVTVPLPAGVSVRSSEFKALMSGLFPVDAARTDGQFSLSMTGRVECEGQANGHTMQLVLTTTQREEHTITIEAQSETPSRTAPKSS